jgi:hypothetical protein
VDRVGAEAAGEVESTVLQAAAVALSLAATEVRRVAAPKAAAVRAGAALAKVVRAATAVVKGAVWVEHRVASWAESWAAVAAEMDAWPMVVEAREVDMRVAKEAVLGCRADEQLEP